MNPIPKSSLHYFVGVSVSVVENFAIVEVIYYLDYNIDCYYYMREMVKIAFQLRRVVDVDMWAVR